MSEQERVPFWQVWRLRLRTLLGWGDDVPEVRHWARVYARGAKGLPILMAAELTLFLVIFALLARMGTGSHRPAPLSFMVSLSLPVLAPPLLLMAVFAFLSVRYSRCADAGEQQAPAALDGHCYATVIAPPMRLFALIGMTREQAQWFCLPIGWETTVEPGADRFDLTYNPATGYVERLRRIGAEPRELRQGAEAAASAGETAETDVTDGEAPPAQRRELKRDFRRAGITWGVAASSLRSTGLSIVFCGVSVLAAIVFTLVMLLRYPQPHTHPADPLSVAMFCAMLGSLGVGLLIWGARVLWISAQWRRADKRPPLVIAGERIRWTPYHDTYGTRSESLALVRLDDGSQLIFRIPARWKHRLWSGNSRVRVTYQAGSGHVLDYRTMDETFTRSSA